MTQTLLTPVSVEDQLAASLISTNTFGQDL